MIQKRTLVLITAMFPYGKRESYLENEIETLSKNFEKVYLLPRSKIDKTLRSVPDNCLIKDLRPEIRTVGISIFDLGELVYELVSIIKNQKTKLWVTCLRSLIHHYLQAKSLTHSLKNFITSEKIEAGKTVFYSYWLDEFSIALAFAVKDKIADVTIARAHNWDIYYELHEGEYLPFRKFVLSQLVQVFTISEGGRKYLLNKTNQHFSNKISVARLGTTNIQRVKNPPALKEELVICSCSTLIKRKRIDLIIDSILLLKTDLPVTWYHIGEEGDERDYLFELSRRKSTENRRLIMLGHKENKAITQFYAQMHIDLFINLSVSEGIPVSIMEANSFGIPAIATNVGGTNEIIEHGQTGYLLPIDVSAELVASAISGYLELFEDEKLKMRNSAFENWDSKYNAEKNYPAFASLLKAL